MLLKLEKKTATSKATYYNISLSSGIYLIIVITGLTHRHWTIWRKKTSDDIFKCVFFNENISISVKISLKFVHMGPIDNKSVLVQLMAWRRTVDTPLPKPMFVQFSDTYISVYCMRQQRGMIWHAWLTRRQCLTLRPGQFGRLIVDDIFQCVFLNENNWLSIKISLKFVPNGAIDSKSALIHVMALRRQATSHYLNHW